MYVLVLSDDATLPVELCVRSALLGHPAGTTRLSDVGSLASPLPGLVLLDAAEPARLPQALSAIRQRYPDAQIAIMDTDDAPAEVLDDEVCWLPKPVTVPALRATIQLANRRAALLEPMRAAS